MRDDYSRGGKKDWENKEGGCEVMLRKPSSELPGALTQNGWLFSISVIYLLLSKLIRPISASRFTQKKESNLAKHDSV